MTIEDLAVNTKLNLLLGLSLLALLVLQSQQLLDERAGLLTARKLWTVPGKDEPVPKTSYVRGFEPWGWIVGTGVYTDDIQAPKHCWRTTSFSSAPAGPQADDTIQRPHS